MDWLSQGVLHKRDRLHLPDGWYGRPDKRSTCHPGARRSYHKKQELQKPVPTASDSPLQGHRTNRLPTVRLLHLFSGHKSRKTLYKRLPPLPRRHHPVGPPLLFLPSSPSKGHWTQAYWHYDSGSIRHLSTARPSATVHRSIFLFSLSSPRVSARIHDWSHN